MFCFEHLNFDAASTHFIPICIIKSLRQQHKKAPQPNETVRKLTLNQVCSFRLFVIDINVYIELINVQHF